MKMKKNLLFLMFFFFGCATVKTAEVTTEEKKIGFSGKWMNVESDKPQLAIQRFQFSSEFKTAVIGACTAAGVTVALIHGQPFLFYAGYHVAQYLAPTTGYQFYMFGYSAYVHAGLAWANSPMAQSAVTTGASFAGGVIGNVVVNGIEMSVNCIKDAYVYVSKPAESPSTFSYIGNWIQSAGSFILQGASQAAVKTAEFTTSSAQNTYEAFTNSGIPSSISEGLTSCFQITTSYINSLFKGTFSV